MSRSDLRRELLSPLKRSHAVSWCNEFYFAVPAGLLKDDELAYVEPEWEPGDFQRTPCPAARRWRGEDGCYRGKRQAVMVGPLTRWSMTRPLVDVPCPDCDGTGYTSKSRVEQEAPMLWVPADVGLVVVHPSGVRVARKSPKRKDVPALGVREIGQMVRWISMRPDPRHARVGQVI